MYLLVGPRSLHRLYLLLMSVVVRLIQFGPAEREQCEFRSENRMKTKKAWEAATLHPQRNPRKSPVINLK